MAAHETQGGLPPLDGLTEPERRAALLDAFSVPDHEGIYVLGCFAHRVTFYSQQVRALNLVDALCHAARVTGRGKVAVIGAGVAGLTAAAGLLRRGARVALFERAADPSKDEGRMPLQQGAKQRVVHPHIYDWPSPDATKENTGLPELVDWKTDKANAVIAQISDKFAAVVRENKDSIEFHHTQDVAVTASPPTVHWNGNTESFEVVILAVGFGREDAQTGSRSYWLDDDLEGPDSVGRTWLISGCGDGGLTDLMRLVVGRFDHKQLLERFSAAVPEADRQKLARADRSTADGEALAKVFREVAANIQLDLELRTIDVWLNCTEGELFRPRASILNRLIAAFLLRSPRIRCVPHPRKIGKPIAKDGGWIVEPNVMDEPTVFHKVILRHGPQRAIEAFDTVWKACEPKFDSWQATAPASDWTRVPMWREGAFDAPPKLPLLPEVDTTARCLVVVSDDRDADLVVASVGHALERAGIDGIAAGNLRIDPVPIVIKVEDAFADGASYAYAVRAICSCQLAVFDVTKAQEKQPGAALLLGIRAAARRGVTITLVREKLDDKTWAALPFNIREVGVLSDAQGDRFIDDIHDAFKDGLKLLASVGEHYRDLPVYDAVRRLGSSPEFYRPVAPGARVLLLSWYDARYATTVGKQIERCLRTELRDPLTQSAPPVLRIINTPSPQLMSDKLYAEIRRARFCVADWTGWRFNVFFELGVRLAVTSDEPVNVVCDDPDWLTQSEIETPAEGKQHAALRSLLAPLSFKKNEDRKLQECFAACRAWIQSRSETRSRWPGTVDSDGQVRRTIPAGYTYALVREAIRLDSESWATPVWNRLRTMSNEILGTRQFPDSPILFAERDRKRLERAGIEHLLAAWLYLEYRVQQGGDTALESDLLEMTDVLYTNLDDRQLLDQPEYQSVIPRLKMLLGIPEDASS